MWAQISRKARLTLHGDEMLIAVEVMDRKMSGNDLWYGFTL